MVTAWFPHDKICISQEDDKPGLLTHLSSPICPLHLRCRPSLRTDKPEDRVETPQALIPGSSLSPFMLALQFPSLIPLIVSAFKVARAGPF